jgi:hypothetical protein
MHPPGRDPAVSVGVVTRQFCQFSDGELSVLARVTRQLAALCAAASYHAKRRSKRDPQADSDFDRYKRCARWIEREQRRRAAL